MHLTIAPFAVAVTLFLAHVDDGFAATNAAKEKGAAALARSVSDERTAPQGDVQFAFAAQPISQARRAKMTGVSWHSDCPVALDDLRIVTLRHWDFSHQVRVGQLIVHRDVVDDIGHIFLQLFELKFPVQQIRPIIDYQGDDFVSIEANNTSAFNCRRRTGGGAVWSRHSYGRALDINPIQNPYVFRGGRVSHSKSERYINRAVKRPGMVLAGDDVVAAFGSRGWKWGGRWRTTIDYQHFSKSGR